MKTGVTISEMKLYLMRMYPDRLRWHEKVQKMKPAQVIAIYRKYTREPKAERMDGSDYHQIDMFEYMASLTQNHTEVNV